MARPLKQGVDYFPLDVYLDDKFKFVQIKYGLEGFAIIIKLLQKIYSCGYWYQWGEDEQLIFKNENHINCETLKNVMNEAFKRDIFNQEMFDKYKILTSSGIQKRYKEIVRRRKDIEITTDYLLIDDIYQVNDDILTTSCKHTDDISTQRKGKERKGKETESKLNKKETPTKKTKFIPPTIEEVSQYCKERNNNIDPEKFVSFYESKDWFIGKNKMVKWKAAVVTWEKKDTPNKEVKKLERVEADPTW